MALAKYEIAKLNGIIASLQTLLVQHSKSTNGATSMKPARRVRRSGKELVAFRKMLIGERKKGVSVATLAKRYRISTAYIYQL